MTCEKCGFEYTGDSCPVCAVQATNEAIVISEKKTSGLGTAGMILGIVSLAMLIFGIGNTIFWWLLIPLLAIPGPIFGAIPSVVGLVLSIAAKKKNPDDKRAKVGKTLSLISLIIKVVLVVVCVVVAVGTIVFNILFPNFWYNLGYSIGSKLYA